VIGFGVNVADAPSDTPYRTIALNRVDHAATPEAVFCCLARSFEQRFTAWQTAHWSGGDAFGPVREAWLARAAALGQEIGVRVGPRNLTGTFLGLDAIGRLLIETREGLETIDAGDLFWPSLRNTSGTIQSLDEVTN
jgi:BirA family biotin operon repressor/biotin-[acetyl-CoA-carboxylase] ligase